MDDHDTPMAAPTPAPVTNVYAFPTRKVAERAPEAPEQVFEAQVTVSEPDPEAELEYFSMKMLKHDRVKPRFEIGDLAWVADYDDDDDNDAIVGYLPIVVIGLEIYPDKVHYMIGFEEDDCMISTLFENVDDDEIFAERPQTLQPHRQRPVLTIVK